MAEEERRGAHTTAPKTETYKYSASSFTTKSNEEELFELVQLSGVPMDKELFKVILELLKLNIAPTAILQILKTIKSKVVTDDSSQSSGRQSPVISVPVSQLSNTALHRVKTDQGSGGAVIDQKSAQPEHKSGQSKTARSAEKAAERTAKATSGSKHRGSTSKHRTPGSGTKTGLHNKT